MKNILKDVGRALVMAALIIPWMVIISIIGILLGASP